MRHHVVELADVDIHVAEAGDGAPLLLLHGWPQHWYCWRRLLPLLPGFRLIMPDTRGFGWSSAPAGQDFRKETLADDLFDVMDALDIDRAAIVGHDWGGWTGFLAALRHPERVAALVAVSVIHPFVGIDVGTVMQSWRFGYQPLIGSPLGPVLLHHSSLLGRMLEWSEDGIDDAGVYADLVARPSQARASERLYRTFLVHELATLSRYRHQRLTVPTSLVVGASDPVIRPSMLRGFERNADEMSLHVLDGVGHFVPESAPVELAALVRARSERWALEHALLDAGGEEVGTEPSGALRIEGPNPA